MKKKSFGFMAASLIAACVALSGCGKTAVCEHELKRTAHQDATCAEAGCIAHYSCEKCGKIYFDEAGNTELTEESVVIGKLPHGLEHYDEVLGDGMNRPRKEYWRCIACGRYYTDGAAQTETTYAELFAGSYSPVKLTDVTLGNIFVSSSETPAIRDNFTFRCFFGFTNAAGERLTKANASSFPNGKIQINFNLNRECTLSGTGWYNFGVGYNAKEGLFYKKLESGTNVAVSKELTDFFLEQGGIPVIVVRDGSTVSFYFEDANGNPQRMDSNSGFGATEALIRLAANQAEGVTGWTSSVTKTAICIGVTDPKCVFDSAYENESIKRKF